MIRAGMVRLATLLLLFVAAQGAERWIGLQSGPLEVYTDAGERVGRQRLNELEQLRYGLEQLTGKTELTPIWPVRVLVFGAPAEPTVNPALARDAFYGALPTKGPPPLAFERTCVELLLDSLLGRLPDAMESALAVLFSTLEIKGSQVLLGAPPPAAERTRDWAEMHMLAVTDEYYGKLRTLIYNLERGVEPEPAYRNAFGKSRAEVAKEADAYLRAGNFTVTQLKRKPISPQKDFEVKPTEPDRIAVFRADLLLADPTRIRQAGTAYQAILSNSPSSGEALEGLGLVALREKRTEEARSLLAKAVEASGSSPRAYVEYARTEPDRDKAVAALEKATKLNPRWGAPRFEMAERESDASLRQQLLAAAVKLEPRNLEYRRALAEQQAALRPLEEAERKRKAEEAKRELEALRERSKASIQAAIDEANRRNPPMAPTSGKVEPWWDGPQPNGKVKGVLRQVDCLGSQARLVIEGGDKKLTRLLVRDPSQIAIAGGGEKSFGCGVQKPARAVVVEYFVKADAKLGTAGEVAVIEFP